MFCSKCGKENNDTAKFCAYCGAELKPGSGTTDASYQPYHVDQTEKVSVPSGIGASGIIMIVLYVILAIPWTDIVLTHFGQTLIAFGLLDSEIVGMICYFLPCVIVITMIVIGIVNIIRNKYYMLPGVVVAVLSVCMKIGAAIFNAVTFETGMIGFICYRVFNPYSTIWVRSLVLSVLLIVFAYAKSRQKKYL